MDRISDYESIMNDLKDKIDGLKKLADESGMDLSDEIEKLKDKIRAKKNEVYTNMTRWQRVELARHPSRPAFSDYVPLIFQNFIELHGDREYGDDRAVISGIAAFNGIPVTVIGIQKGRNIRENIERNFGMPNPEGYRKALRQMKLAEKFKRPVICFIDTPGAYPGVGAEERGQGQAIAANLYEMSALKVPIISIVIGEGGSGGALALGVANIVMMLENSIYSVISPEGFASIIYKDSSRSREAADVLKLTSYDLLEFKVIDKIIKEPMGGAHKSLHVTAENIKKEIGRKMKSLVGLSCEDLVKQRYERFRSMGFFVEAQGDR